VGRIPAAALFVVVTVRRRMKKNEEGILSVSTNHQVPRHWFEAVLWGRFSDFLKLTSGSVISSILTNQRTFGCGFFIYIFTNQRTFGCGFLICLQIKEPLVVGF
jgi:hypothetical protein